MKTKYTLLITALCMFLFVDTTFAQNCPPSDSLFTMDEEDGIRFIEEPTVGQTGDTDPPPPIEGERLIYWVHGLGGSTESWVTASGATALDFKVRSVRPTYSEFTLANAGQDLDNDIASKGVPLAQLYGIEDLNVNFIIAHSQGGLASRAIERYYENSNTPEASRQFGGIVTFGTPHGGAQIINNIPDILDFSTFSCEALVAGPREEVVQESFILDLLIPDEVIANALDGVCGFVGDFIAPLAFEDFTSPITEEYKVGAGPLEELNNFQSSSDIRKVAFYGVEQDPVVWRLLHSLTENPNEEPAFGADFDDETMEKANELMLSYLIKVWAYDALYGELTGDGCNWWQWIVASVGCAIDGLYDDVLNLDAVFGLGEDEARDIRDGYKEGFLWWVNANDNFKSLIGALEIEEQEVGFMCSCENGDTPFGGMSTIVSHPEMCTYYNCEAIPVIQPVVTEKPSDGIVLAESAMAFPGVNYVEVMPGSNHQQMRNDGNLKVRRDELMKDGLYGDYFKTIER
jgi:hypothetical protein